MLHRRLEGFAFTAGANPLHGRVCLLSCLFTLPSTSWLPGDEPGGRCGIDTSCHKWDLRRIFCCLCLFLSPFLSLKSNWEVCFCILKKLNWPVSVLK